MVHAARYPRPISANSSGDPGQKSLRSQSATTPSQTLATISYHHIPQKFPVIPETPQALSGISKRSAQPVNKKTGDRPRFLGALVVESDSLAKNVVCPLSLLRKPRIPTLTIPLDKSNYYARMRALFH